MNQQERQQFVAHWEQVRGKGIFLYILPSALTWGTCPAVIIRLIMVILGQGLSLSLLEAEFTSREFLVFWGVFLLGGLCYSLTMWFYYQWLYGKYRPRPEENPTEQ